MNDRDRRQVQEGATVLIKNQTFLWKATIIEIRYGGITPRENLCPLGTVLEDSSIKAFRSTAVSINLKSDVASVLYGKKA